MRILNHLLYSTCFILIITSQIYSQQSWDKINFKEKFRDTLLVNDHFVYSDYVFKDENGQWQSDMADENGNPILDTTLYLIGSNCVIDNGDPHQARFCDCLFKEDSLFITIYDNNAAYFDEISITGFGNKFSTSYRAVYQVYYPGEKYVWETKKQKLKLSTDKFQKGRWLNGFINTEVTEFFKSNTYPLSLSTIKIKGFFKCIIK
jgi:hypothetical protein